MVQYLEQVDRTVQSIMGPRCESAIQYAFGNLTQMVQSSSGARKAGDLFNTCNTIKPAASGDWKELASFWSTLISPWMGTVQVCC